MATEQDRRDRKTLLTSDGKGRKAKEEALERIINAAIENKNNG